MYYQKLINFNPCKKEYFMSFKLRSLTLAVATFSAMTAHSAGLDRSGQDITGFLQDGDYADIIYTHIDADIKGKDISTSRREVKDIAPSYDFFRYNVKSDVNDRVSVGVLYDEPFGAKVKYQGVNNFTGAANDVAIGTIQNVVKSPTVTQISNQALAGATQFATVAGSKSGNEKIAYTLLSGLLSGTASNIVMIQGLANTSSLPDDVKEIIDNAQARAQGAVNKIKNLISDPNFDAKDKAVIAGALQNYGTSSRTLSDMNNVLKTVTSDNGGTSVEVHTRNITGLVGVKFGEKKNIQVYGGPAFQKLEGEVHLRGNSYKKATGYDAQISPNTALGWVAGVSYSKPEIALKAALTYRSEIEHSSDMSENLPLASLAGLPSQARNGFKVTTPKSYNLDFQTGLSAKHRLLGTLKVRYVPWNNFAITPPFYNRATKTSQNPKGYNIVDYAKEQWSAEIGLGKQVNDKLSVAGNLGWDSGAGNPTTSLGPVKGYYSVGLGAKYNITPNWALSAGAKYLKFGDATAKLPDGSHVGQFEKNDGYIVGVKLSYQNK